MIQRIQTLYMLAVTALMVVALCVPIATFTTANGEVYTLDAYALSSALDSQSTLWMGIVMTLSAVLPFVTIFLFKNRMLQVRLCAVELVLLLGTILFMGIYFWLAGANALEDAEVVHRHIGWAAIMPLVAIPFSLLAARATFKDEMLVRSLDRIR